MAAPEMITVTEAAKRMGMDAMLLGDQIRLGIFPIGWAFNTTGRQWRDYIVRAEFEDLMSGKLPSNRKALAREIAEEVVKGFEEQRLDAI